MPSEYVLPNCRIAGGAPYGTEGTSLKWLCDPALLGTTYGVIRDAEATRICNQGPACHSDEKKGGTYVLQDPEEIEARRLGVVYAFENT